MVNASTRIHMKLPGKTNFLGRILLVSDDSADERAPMCSLYVLQQVANEYQAGRSDVCHNKDSSAATCSHKMQLLVVRYDACQPSCRIAWLRSVTWAKQP
eukprot:TRINITY_DN63666_c0_g1_i1.p2 TRINITY_DN63666_c0_g1~~TRINITY_DN63666_c0_g1_i1.p2  ORF type:complete len:100 (+),score=10.88 TRINITY_DN63666_c0_g1_i1:191-490(+)